MIVNLGYCWIKTVLSTDCAKWTNQTLNLPRLC